MTNSPFSKDVIEKLRSGFAHIQNGHTYLNHAAIGPLSNQVKSALDSFINERHFGPIENLEHSMAISGQTRQLIARYINSPNQNQISFMGNTSEAMSAITEGLDWKNGDEIILNSMEFPTNVQPYRALAGQGVKTNIIDAANNRITPEQIEEAINPRTRVVSISAVQFLSGFKADLKTIGEICKKHNILFVVDAIQCLGAAPIDVQDCKIDALATGAHKWLMSPMGIGFLYCSETLAGQLRPFRTGWLSVEEPWDLFNYEQNWLPLSQHLEVGTPNMLGITGLGASLQSFFDIGTDNIEAHIRYITRYLINQINQDKSLSLISADEDFSRAGIVSFKVNQKKDANDVVSRLKKKKITISAREGLFRISPHYYNTTEEIDKVLGEIV